MLREAIYDCEAFQTSSDAHQQVAVCVIGTNVRQAVSSAQNQCDRSEGMHLLPYQHGVSPPKQYGTCSADLKMVYLRKHRY